MSSLLDFPTVQRRRPIKYRPSTRICRAALHTSERIGDANSNPKTIRYQTRPSLRSSLQLRNECSSRKVRFQEAEAARFGYAILSYEDLLCLIAGFAAEKPRTPIRIPFHGDRREQLQSETHSPCLQLAEFFWRSAQQLGYRTLEETWHSSFRTCTKFTVLDVKRWRRLAHTDWTILDTQVADSETRTNVYEKVSNWFQRRWMDEKAMAKVSNHEDLSQLVSIVNSCIYLGTFQFRQRDIVQLCNFDIDYLR
uniref:AlNc14C64G4565 protein n=1 Tax=Albugo laibachii Nc14 TaxID=890382 RepID=F0WD44_9STRA|nr:AlNc14C64G4565 [Albugo laibachii Nc14]|eukprot:CCA19116.1 AlNc14C64G4565 [Albugo laibachii Nc14]